MDGPWMGHGWAIGGCGTAEATLDFGLFTSSPGFVELLVLCIPVFWVTLLAMSPGCNKPSMAVVKVFSIFLIACCEC